MEVRRRTRAATAAADAAEHRINGESQAEAEHDSLPHDDVERDAHDSSNVDDEVLPAGNKGVLTAYLLYFMGGFFGLHHAYLGRTKHAAVWMTSGGLFGFGLLRDLWMIPSHVLRANQDNDDLASKYHLALHSYESKEKGGKRPKPHWFFSYANLATLTFTLWYRFVAINVLPQFEGEKSEHYDLLSLVIGAIATAGAVYTFQTLGYRRTGSYTYALVGAVLGEIQIRRNPMELDIDDDGNEIPFNGFHSGIWTMLFAWFVFSFSLKFTPAHPKPIRRGSCTSIKSFGKAAFVAGAFWAICCTGMYHNMTIDAKNGDTVRFKDALYEILDSPAWAQLATVFKDLYQILTERGWEEFLSKFNEMLDADGEWAESNAYKTLGLEPEATQSEIKKAVRKYQKMYHPDICKLDKDMCETKFMEIQKANELLDDRSRKRKSANSRSEKGKKSNKKKKKRRSQS